MCRSVTQLLPIVGRTGGLARRPLASTLLLVLAGCALRPAWHWEKPGASEAQYERETIQCKSATYSGTDGMVTQEMVRRMHACLEAKGWRKVEGRSAASGS